MEEREKGLLVTTTRPDTRPIPVADGWAGAKMRVFTLFDSHSPTDQRTEKASFRVASPRPKRPKTKTIQLDNLGNGA